MRDSTMLHRITNESLAPLAEAVRLATGIEAHASTTSRWSTRGVAGIKLETVLVGGRRYASQEAVQRFVDGVTELKNG